MLTTPDRGGDDQALSRLPRCDRYRYVAVKPWDDVVKSGVQHRAASRMMGPIIAQTRQTTCRRIAPIHASGSGRTFLPSGAAVRPLQRYATGSSALVQPSASKWAIQGSNL